MARRRQDRIPAVEWVSGAIGLAIVVSTIAYLALETLKPAADQPALSVTVLQVRERDGVFVVDVEVRNDSRTAAADVHVAGRIPSTGAGEPGALARIDYVPGLSRRHASLVFGVDPGAHPVVRVVGYAKP